MARRRDNADVRRQEWIDELEMSEATRAREVFLHELEGNSDDLKTEPLKNQKHRPS